MKNSNKTLGSIVGSALAAVGSAALVTFYSNYALAESPKKTPAVAEQTELPPCSNFITRRAPGFFGCKVVEDSHDAGYSADAGTPKGEEKKAEEKTPAKKTEKKAKKTPALKAPAQDGFDVKVYTSDNKPVGLCTNLDKATVSLGSDTYSVRPHVNGETFKSAECTIPTGSETKFGLERKTATEYSLIIGENTNGTKITCTYEVVHPEGAVSKGKRAPRVDTNTLTVTYTAPKKAETKTAPAIPPHAVAGASTDGATDTESKATPETDVPGKIAGLPADLTEPQPVEFTAFPTSPAKGTLGNFGGVRVGGAYLSSTVAVSGNTMTFTGRQLEVGAAGTFTLADNFRLKPAVEYVGGSFKGTDTQTEDTRASARILGELFSASKGRLNGSSAALGVGVGMRQSEATSDQYTFSTNTRSLDLELRLQAPRVLTPTRNLSLGGWAEGYVQVLNTVQHSPAVNKDLGTSVPASADLGLSAAYKNWAGVLGVGGTRTPDARLDTTYGAHVIAEVSVPLPKDLRLGLTGTLPLGHSGDQTGLYAAVGGKNVQVGAGCTRYSAVTPTGNGSERTVEAWYCGGNVTVSLPGGAAVVSDTIVKPGERR